jgi:transposase-like protein
MAVKKVREYTKEFRQEAVKLAQELSSVPGAAKKLGIPASVLYAWRTKLKKDGADAFPGKGKLVPEAAKLSLLEAENRRLKMENEFLKKAATYFAAHQK